MPHTKIATRSALSIAVLSLIGMSAHAEIIYQNQPATSQSSYNSTLSNPNSWTPMQTQQAQPQAPATKPAVYMRPAQPASAMPNGATNSTSSSSTLHPYASDIYNSATSAPSMATRSTTPTSFPIAIQRMPAPPLATANSTNPATPISTPTRAMPTHSMPARTAVPARPARTAQQATVTQTAASPALIASLTTVPMPTVTISDIDYLSNITIPTSSYGSEQLDVSSLDEFIEAMSPHARHYPPNFDNASHKYYSTKELEEKEAWLRPYAERPDASFEVLLRAAKLNGMARNLDFGSEYAVRGSNYVARAIKQQPNSAEANFLYGMMLAEGGGFREGQKYLDKAASMGYLEAEQSLAQSDLLRDRKTAALERLQRLQRENPDNMQIRRQLEIVENGKYYIWDLEE